MRARILAIAKTPPPWLRTQCAKYTKRVLPPWNIASEYLPQSRFHGKNDTKAAQEDNTRLLAASKGKIRIAMDKSGTSLSSEQLARWLDSFTAQGEVCFLLGGPLGMDQATRAQCEHVLSLSSLTLPHALAHLLLLEQLYRANSIVRKSGYHK